MLILSSPSEVARHLRKLRKEAGWTLKEAGERAGLSASEVGNAENPNDPGRVAAREALAKLYGFSLNPAYTFTPLEGRSSTEDET